MEKFKKIICCLLIAVMVSVTPLADFVQIEQNVNKAEASTIVGGSALLELILAGFGVTVAGSALSSVTDSFSGWLDVNGSEEAKTNWAQALAAKTVTVGAKLIADVGTWLGKTIPDLNAGSVSVSSYVSGYFYNSAQKEYWSQYISSYPYFVICGSILYLYMYPVKVEFDGSLVKISNLHNTYNSYKYFRAHDSYSSSDSLSSSGVSRISISNISKISTNCEFVDSSGNALESQFKSLDGAFTSYGGYASSNLDDLDGLLVDSSLVAMIMAGVTSAVLAGTVNNDDGSVTYADGIAQSISDAYAQGLADAKAQQDSLIENQYRSGVVGFLQSILDAILALPTLIFEAFRISLTGIQETVVSLPQTLTQNLADVFPSAAYVGELFTTFPAHLVEALTEVFPTSQILTPLITDIPASIVRLLGFDIPAEGSNVRTLADVLADIKEGVLAIPASISDAISTALEKVFAPDLTKVEEQIATIQDSFGWVPQVNDMVNDMMLKLEAGQPPTLYLDFTKAESSKYHGAGRVLAIDFGWYAPYKPTGDLVFGAFLWVLYIWYLFKRLPDIISGAGFITRQSINADNRTNQKRGGNNE